MIFFKLKIFKYLLFVILYINRHSLLNFIIYVTAIYINIYTDLYKI